jgi:phage minor structural protein
MSYPILYSATETKFCHNGIGILSACVSCEVTEEGNGIFELSMQYPMDGIHFENITDRVIIKAKADQFREPQLFRVYAVSKPMAGIVTVLAEHISYDLSGIPVKPFSADSVALALSGLKSNAVVPCPFNFWTDKATSAKFSVKTPASIRSRLGGVSGSILDVYGGEYEFDNYTVKLHNNRGLNRGVSIRYGKNLTDIKQDQNCSSVATGVYPYWVSPENGELVELPEKIINAPGTYNFVKIRTVDFSQSFEKKPTEEQLRKKTESYIKNNDIGVPKVSMTVSFAQLEQTEEYKHLKLLERVSLFDRVNVEFPALRVSATAKAVKLVYDVLADRVKSVTFGSVRANIADTIVQQQQEISQLPSKSFLELAVETLTKDILGATGGSVRFLDTNEDGEPDTLYIADNPDPLQAVKVWRFNYEGWGASENGYNGPFKLGATLKNGIVADFITSGTLNANLINVTNLSADNIVSGVLSSQKGNATLDLSTGQLEFISQYGGDRKTTISDGNIVLGGITSKDYVFLHNNGIYFFDMNGEFTGFIDGWTEYGMRIHCLNADGLDTSIRALRWKQIGDDWVLVGVDPLNDPGV